MLELTRLADLGEITAEYDDKCSGHQLHLLDHVKATSFPDGDILSLEHQVPLSFSLLLFETLFKICYIKKTCILKES
jgi:hypothetical protein